MCCIETDDWIDQSEASLEKWVAGREKMDGLGMALSPQYTVVYSSLKWWPAVEKPRADPTALAAHLDAGCQCCLAVHHPPAHKGPRQRHAAHTAHACPPPVPRTASGLVTANTVNATRSMRPTDRPSAWFLD